MNSDAQENRESQPMLPAHAPRLRLSASSANGPTSCEASAPVVLVGGRRDCALSLPSLDVSKIHCALVNTGQAIIVRDLLSRSGTYVNEQLIRSVILKPGDTLRVGPTQIELDFSGGFERLIEDQPDPLRLVTPLRLEFKGDQWEIVENGTIIGRRHTADLMVDTPDVSLAHALVFVLEGRPAIYDLGSRSGTFVNGERVGLRWLNDGDQLDIGGEQLAVHWEHATDVTDNAELAADFSQNRPTASENDLPGDKPAFHPIAPLDDPTHALGDLEQSLAVVQSQVLAARTRIEESELELKQRDIELVRKSTELESGWKALTQAEEALAHRRKKLDILGSDLEQKRLALATETAELKATCLGLEKQQEALNEATEVCCQREEELKQRSADLDASAAQFTRQGEELEAERAKFAQRINEQEEAAALLDGWEKNVAEREAALESREREFAARETALIAREARDAEILEKIAQFKSALNLANENLAGCSASELKMDTAPTQPINSSDSPSVEVTNEELPAPVVDQPLFSTDGGTPPEDWPEALRDRYHILRRVSTKTNDELLTQVWADRERVLAQGSSPCPPTNNKRKRRLWGN